MITDVMRQIIEDNTIGLVATVTPDGSPAVSPKATMVILDAKTIAFSDLRSPQTVRNIRHNPNVAFHWQVTESGDGLEIWGPAQVFTDIETKRRLWIGVFDYDLNAFSSGGPEDPSAAFIGVTPTRALFVKSYGAAGKFPWKATGTE